MLPEEPRLFAVRGAGEMLFAPAGEAAQPTPDSPAEQAERIGQMFGEALRRYGLEGRFITRDGRPGETVAALSRTTDIVVLGQPEPGQERATAHRRMAEDVLMTSGRPVLMIPFAGDFAKVGSNVLIGWSEKAEAARAAHDVMELADAGAQFTVLTVRHRPRPVEESELLGAAMARHITRHGFAARAAETVAVASLPASFIVRPELTEADALLNYAADITADLLAVGCYGHSRTREMVLGGVTRDLIDHMTLPVLMSR
ncbi:MAG: universal stress protein [Acetobacteraceae bacterium]